MSQQLGASGTYEPRAPASNLIHDASTRQTHVLPSQTPTISSTIDDYRGVIDDLTIENKRLRQELRSYTEPPYAEVERDKLFEVKTYGLSSQQKRQLEETLTSFALSLDVSTAPSDVAEDIQNGGSMSRVSKLVGSQRSSPTSNSQRVDSAYASMATSGLALSPAPNNSKTDVSNPRHQIGLETKRWRTLSHDILGNSHTHSSTRYSEANKKKMVVRRLEHLFTGKKLLAAGSQTPSASESEIRSGIQGSDKLISVGGDTNLSGGVREAHILPNNVDIEISSTPERSRSSSTGPFSNRRDSKISDSMATVRPSSPKQRPTRPTELDPARAQIPSENLDYIRHLGVLSPTADSADSNDSSAPNEDWIYLNLLINMAQLHMLNVTPDFVRSAVSEVSSKFQLSLDGRKIRWRGSPTPPRLTSNDGSAHELSSIDSDQLLESNKIESNVDTGDQERNESRSVSSGVVDRRSHNVHYTPLFRHGHTSQEEEDSSSDEGSFSESWRLTSDAVNDPTRRSKMGWKKSIYSDRTIPRQTHAGGIIFYTGASFCTDLSAERSNNLSSAHIHNLEQDNYETYTPGILGCTSSKDSEPGLNRTASGSLLDYKPFKANPADRQDPPADSEPTEVSDMLDEDNIEDLDLPNHADYAVETDHCNNSSLVSFEASGLGGIRPADHFLLTVRTTRHVSDDTERRQQTGGEAPILAIPFPQPVIPGHGYSSAVRSSPVTIQVLSTQIQQLEPSALPPPITFFGGASSEDDDDDDDDGDNDGSDEDSVLEGEDDVGCLSRDEVYLPCITNSNMSVSDDSLSLSRDEDVHMDGASEIIV